MYETRLPRTNKYLTGERFGRLTPQYIAGHNKHRSALWHCICECGNTVQVETQRLTSGRVRSCGCLKAGIDTKKRKLDEFWNQMLKDARNDNG